jgi:hypothetical protein
MQFDSLNFGKKFYSRYDRRHDISVVAFYKLSHNITLTGTWVYGTGNAITLPSATYFAFSDNNALGSRGRNANIFGYSGCKSSAKSLPVNFWLTIYIQMRVDSQVSQVVTVGQYSILE